MPLGFELLQIPSLVAHFGGEQESGGFLRDTLTRFMGLKANLHHAPAWLQTVVKQIVAQGKD